MGYGCFYLHLSVSHLPTYHVKKTWLRGEGGLGGGELVGDLPEEGLDVEADLGIGGAKPTVIIPWRKASPPPSTSNKVSPPPLWKIRFRQ